MTDDALEGRYRLVIENAHEGIWAADAERRTTFVNARVAEMLGYSREELLGRDFGELLAPHDAAGLAERLARRRSGAAEVFDCALQHKDGRTVWAIVSTSAIVEDGEYKGSLALLTDITARKRAEMRSAFLTRCSAILASELDYQRTLTNLAEMTVPELADWCAIDLVDGRDIERIAVVHRDPAKVHLAHELSRRYPMRRGDGNPISSAIDAVETRFAPAISEESLRKSAYDDDHLRILHELGVRSSLVVPLVASGTCVGAISLVTAESGRVYDESEKTVAEELARRAGMAIANARLYASEQRANDHLALLARAGEAFGDTADYEATLRNVVALALPVLGDYGFFDVREGGEVRRFAGAHDDPETARFFQGTRWEPRQTSELNLCALSSGKAGFHPDIDDAWMQKAAVNAEQLAGMRRRGLRSLITVPLVSRGAPIGALTLCFARSRRRHAQKDLDLAEELARRSTLAIEQARLYRAAQEAARHAEEANRVKDDFLATVSHELRTPLNAISGWVQVLARKPGDATTVARGLEIIRRNAQAQTKLVEDILDVSRIITGKLRIDTRPIDAVAIVREAMDVVRPSAEARGVLVTLETGDAPCLLVGDPERLQQVVWNLLSNAVKFSHAGGRVTVSVAQEGAEVAIVVSDTGLGIAQSFLPQVFERFKQADSSTTRKFGGLGLGLAIVRHIVELHGGRVFASSEGPDKGASFRVVLPVRALSRPAEEEAGTPSPRVDYAGETDLRGVRVLVVDDEADARDFVELVLAEEGALVETARTSGEALAALERSPPDVLVADIGLPDEDGYALVQKVRALPRGKGGAVPAVALTAFARAEDRMRALTSGYNVHMPKPVQPRELVTVVANLANVSGR